MTAMPVLASSAATTALVPPSVDMAAPAWAAGASGGCLGDRR